MQLPLTHTLHNLACCFHCSFAAAGLVSESLATGVGYTRVGLLPAATLTTMFLSPKWEDKFEHATPDSNLHYSVTQAEALVRYTSTPVYASSSTDLFGTDPIGVMITVDAVNGKTRIPEVCVAFYMNT
jgi:hypothetical protein